MTRKLKTYLTSQGFYDLAVAAPSMKAALGAWGSNINLFHRGFAKETDDPAIVAATMKQPGVILQRPVGTDAPFQEHAPLPASLPSMGAPREKAEKPRKQPKKAASAKADQNSRKAALAFEKEQQRRERKRQKEQAAREKERERRQGAVAKVQAEYDKAQREHDNRVEAIEKARATVDERSEAEDARWQKLKEHLEAALRRAGG